MFETLSRQWQYAALSANKQAATGAYCLHRSARTVRARWRVHPGAQLGQLHEHQRHVHAQVHQQVRLQARSTEPRRPAHRRRCLVRHGHDGHLQPQPVQTDHAGRHRVLPAQRLWR